MQCSAGLQLLTKLLDFEFNRDADIYIQVFAKETALQLYKELRLGMIKWRYLLFLTTKIDQPIC